MSGKLGPRARRAPAVNAVELARATVALNKVGCNLNQISRVLNAGVSAGITVQQCEMVLEEIRTAAAAIRESAGHKKRQ